MSFRLYFIIFCILVITSSSLQGQTVQEFLDSYKNAEKREAWAECEKICRQALLKHESVISFHSYLNYALRMQKKNKAALIQIETAYKKFGNEKYIMLNYKYSLLAYGWQLNEDNNKEQAHRLFKKAVEIDANDPDCLNAYGYILKELGKQEQAREVLADAYERFPDHKYIKGNYVASLLSLGWEKNEQNKQQEVESLFLKAYQIDPQDQWVLNAYGYILRETGRVIEAINILETAFTQYKQNQYIKEGLINSYLRLANKLRDEQEYKKAKPYYEKAAAIDSEYEWVLLNYGVFLYKTENFPQAIVMLRKGLKKYPANSYFSPNLIQAYLNYSHDFAQKKEYQKALDILKQAEQNFAHELWILLYLSDYYKELKQYKKAGEYLINAVDPRRVTDFGKKAQLDAEKIIVHRLNSLVFHWATLGKYQEGFNLLNTMDKYFPDQYFMLAIKGRLTYHAGEKDKGLDLEYQSYEKYIKHHPEQKKPIVIDFPLKGIYLISGNSRRDAITHAGLNQFCFDFMGADEEGNIKKSGIKGQGENNDYYGFGDAVYAPVNGVVERVIDHYADIKPRKQSVLGEGNEIIITDQAGLHYVFVHNKQYTAKVKEGQKVKKGQLICELGNTGYTCIPHLHFGIYSEDWEVSLPIIFENYTIIQKDGKRKKIKQGVPQDKEVIEIKN